jgi:hypothetical protein
VFAVVGVALASIALWLVLFVRRRRRTRRLEHETAVSATLAAAGFGRSPLHDDEEESEDMHSSGNRSSAFMGQRPGSASILGSRAPSTFAAYTDPFAGAPATYGHGGPSPEALYGYDMHGPGPAREGGYAPTRTGTPPLLPPGLPAAAQTPGRSAHQHTSSYEPLLGAAGLALGQRTPGTLSPPGSPPAHSGEGYFSSQMASGHGGRSPPPPAVPPRSPRRPSYSSQAAPPRAFSPSSSVYSDDGDDQGTVHEPEGDSPGTRLEVRNPGAGVSRASSLAN